MGRRLINTVIWLLVAGSVAIILGGLMGRPVLVAAVPTSSMVPVLRPGDLIPILPFMGSDPKQGQVIVFKTPRDNTWIVHRIVGGNSENGFITRGDANPVPDPTPVHARDVAGFVPRLGSWVIRIPNLGSISLRRSPLSNPVVAAATLLLGVYLLLSDPSAGLSRLPMMRIRKPVRVRLTNSTVVAVYVGLGTVISIMTLLTTLSLAFHQEARYTVVASRTTRINDARITALGEPRVDTVTIKNPSYIPLIAGLYSNDQDLEWEPSWLFLPGKSERTVTITRHSRSLGTHSVSLRQAYYLPLMPTAVLRALATGGWILPAVFTCLGPLVLVVALAISDHRVQFQLRTALLHIRNRV